ncbi:MAG: hypothetical protein V2A64_02245 [Candidatus Omnitrophota bacterium]
MRKSGENLKALSLLEILVAVIVLSLIILGSTGLFVASKGRILHSRWRMTAGEAGRLFLGPLQGEVRGDTWSTSCLNGGACVSTPEQIDGMTFTPAYTVGVGTATGLIPNLNRVQVRVSWTEASVSQ